MSKAVFPDSVLFNKRQSDVYSALFIIENILRVAIYNCIKRELNKGYTLSDLFPPFKNDKIKNEFNLVDEIVKKKKESKKNKLLGFVFPDIWYIDYFQMLILIDTFKDSIFFDLFIKNANNINPDLLNKLFSITEVRNSIAHNRYISKSDHDQIISILTLLKENINTQYIVNYTELVFTIPDELRNQLVSCIEKIKKKIDTRSIVESKQIELFSVSFESLLCVSRLSDDALTLHNAIKSSLIIYNSIPRVPGIRHTIKQSIDKTGILIQIELLIDLIGRPE